MKNTDVEALLNTAVNDAVPDVLDGILSRCPEREGKVVEMKTPISISWAKPLCATAAALALIVGGLFGANSYKQSNTTDSVVSLDVNPSIEIETNKNDKVLAVRGLNADGENVVAQKQADGESLKGESIESAVAQLVGTMVEDGYLGEEANSVLLSVESASEERSLQLERSLMQSASTAMADRGVDGAVIAQNVSSDETLSKTAEELGVSKGKAGLITALVAQNPEYSAQSLSKLSINELGILSKESETEGITIIGSPSTKKYVSAEAAIDEACAGAKVELGEDTAASAKIGVEDGKLVYDVSIKLGGESIKCEVDAVTGKLIGLIDSLLGGSLNDPESTDKADDTDDTSGRTTTVPSAVGDVVDGTISGVGEVIGGTISGVGEVIGGTVSGVGEVIGGTISGVGEVVGGTVSGVGDIVGGATDGAGEVIGGAASGVGDVVGSAVDGTGNVVDTAVSGVGGIIDSALNDPQNVENAAEDYADDVENAADSLVDGVISAIDSWIGGGTTGGTTGGSTGNNSGGTTGGNSDSSGGLGGLISGLFS